MAISKRRITLMAISLFAFVGLSQIVLESFVDARAGGGGSAAFAAPGAYQCSPADPLNRPNPDEKQLPRRSNLAHMAPQPGGFMRSFGTAMLGGFLGSMLFSGLANAGFGGLGGFGSSGIGLVEILLFAGLGYFLYRKFLGPAAATGYGTMQYQNTRDYSPQYTPVQEAPAINNDIDYRSLTMMDRSFDPNQFLKTAQDIFFKVQGAWNKQDTAALRSLCGSELMQTWEQELNNLRARGQQNKMENIALRESEITEAWTENGQDYITVRLHANLLDYTVDQKSGNVVSGNNSDPIEFQEYWTFTRPVGPNPWKLTAVQQA